MDFLRNKHARAAAGLLALQGIAYYALAMLPERLPDVGPLANFPYALGGWQTIEESQIAADEQEVLKADDTLIREYANAERTDAVSLFLAFFKTQRAGQSPHSPKNCLPGNGWEPTETGVAAIEAPGRAKALLVNRYVVTHGDEKSVVYYWYQSHDRVIASEYSAKFWLVADSIRYHRSDTALVRVIVAVRAGNVEAAEKTGAGFIRTMFPAIEKQLPA